MGTFEPLPARLKDVGREPAATNGTRAPRQHTSEDVVVGYRPWLDGVRAVAILAVLVQHTWGSTSIELGSIGVGLFFGLSGYLITSLLLDERARRGSVSLRSFYLRRAARLVPALLLVVVACDALFIVEGELRPIAGSFASVTYTANYVLIAQPDAVPGFGPTWSLAVEEHFYLLWPLFLLWITGRYGPRPALRATLAICGGSLLWRVVLATVHAPMDLLAIGSFERADALLYGCAAAMAVRLGWRPRRWMLWVVVCMVLALPYAMRHESYAALVIGNAALAVAAAGLAVGLDYSAPTWLRRGFSTRWLVALGVVSYGVYLWHGPLMRISANAGFEGRSWRAVVAAASIVIATVSYRLLEQPIRVRVRRQTSRNRQETPDSEPEPSTGAALGASTAGHQ
jgi:peptidoglycan/LPS O-acetylase OafA/YrhL